MICKYFLLYVGSVSWWCPLKHKSFKFWWSPVCFFSFTCTFGTISKKTLTNSWSWRFTPMFSSKSFTVLFRSLAHFELILWDSSPNSFFLFFFALNFFLTEIELIYNVVLVSDVQQSDSVIHIYKYIYSFYMFFSIIGYYKTLSIVPCAIQ